MLAGVNRVTQNVGPIGHISQSVQVATHGVRLHMVGIHMRSYHLLQLHIENMKHTHTLYVVEHSSCREFQSPGVSQHGIVLPDTNV